MTSCTTEDCGNQAWHGGLCHRCVKRKQRGPLGNATRYISEWLSVTQVLVDGRLPFDGPDGPVGGDADDRRPTGAMQPSALVIFDRPDVRKGAA